MSRPRLAIVPTAAQRERVDAYRAKIGGAEPVAPRAERPQEPRRPREDPGAALEHAIEAAMRVSALTPSARICLEGHVMHVQAVELPGDDGSDEPEVGFRNINTAPLEALFHSKRNPLELYQYLAGCRFRMDWHLSQIGPMGAVDYTRGSMYVTDALQRHQAQGYIPGIDGPALAAALRAANPTPDSTIDAMDRLGAAIDALAKDRAWMALKWIGEEWPIVAMAKHLSCDERVVNWSVRRMLDELASHYRLRAGRRKM